MCSTLQHEPIIVVCDNAGDPACYLVCKLFPTIVQQRDEKCSCRRLLLHTSGSSICPFMNAVLPLPGQNAIISKSRLSRLGQQLVGHLASEAMQVSINLQRPDT